MICSTCGSRIPDGSHVCPMCHALQDTTQSLSLGGATWCPGCGALVGPEVEVCPKCGTSVAAHGSGRPMRDLDLPEIGNTDALDLTAVPQIESAIPSADDAATPGALRDRIPRPRAFAFAALLALVVVGGVALYITHPWDPNATRISAEVPADTSMQGFPGFVESLKGQDVGKADASSAKTAAEVIAEKFEALSKLSSRADACEKDLSSTGVSGTADERAAGLDAARGVAIDVSNLITEIDALGTSDSEHADDVEHLRTLSSWLRNRCDALSAAWELSSASEDPEADKERILARAAAGEDYARLFEKNFEAWS